MSSIGRGGFQTRPYKRHITMVSCLAARVMPV
jgi:hypothetical protein